MSGVLDIGMPELSGYEVAKHRMQPWGEHLTLIALTGWGQESDDKRRATAAGFDHHCTKPVDPDELQRCFMCGR